MEIIPWTGSRWNGVFSGILKLYSLAPNKMEARGLL